MSQSKRPHVKTERMQEFMRAQDDANSPTKKLKCPEPGCNKMFTSAPGLKYHRQTHRTENPQFSCGKCLKVFKRYFEFVASSALRCRQKEILQIQFKYPMC